MNARHTLITAHFRLDEFDCRDGSLVPGRDEIAIEYLCRWWLEPLRARFGQVTVHSGFRSPAYNTRIGGARASVHMLRTALPHAGAGANRKAAAADVTCANGSPATWAAWARHHRAHHDHLARRGRGGIGQYPTFVHLDTAGERCW